MKNILSKYRKNKLFSNISIIMVSLVLAIWINLFLIDWSNLSQFLKTSVINSEISEQKADISLNNINSDIYLISNKQINNINNLSLSLSYNPKNISIQNIESSFWNVLNLWNTPWFNSIILTIDKSYNIKKWDKLLKINTLKKEKIAENLNIINANFKDIDWETYLLSTSWINF